MSNTNEYRLLHTKNGKYILQVKKTYEYVDYKENKLKKNTTWASIETVEEKSISPLV